MPPLDTIQIPLTLNAAQVNYILAALGARPFAEVKDLIEDIKKQGDAQLSDYGTRTTEPLAEAA